MPYQYGYKRYSRKKGLNLTLLLIIINVAVFIAVLILQATLGEGVFNLIAVTPSAILAGKNLWTIITNMFVHANFLHLFVNMLSLFFLGSFLERLIGKKRYILIYFISGIVASLFFVFLAGSSMQNIPAVGASGAIFGLAGVLALITPKLPVYIMFIPIPIPLWIGVVGILVIMWAISLLAGLPIGNTAHLGGLLAGAAYGLFLRTKHKRKIQVLDKMFR